MKKEQIASGTVKLSCVMCMVVFVGGLLDAKNAQFTGESKNCEGPLGRKKTNQANQGAKGTSKVTCWTFCFVLTFDRQLQM